MTIKDPKKTKRQQIILTLSGVAFCASLLGVTLWASDPSNGKPTALQAAREKAKEVDKNFTVSSADTVSDKERWIASSEKAMASFQTSTQEMQQKIQLLTRKLEELERARGTQPEAGASTPVVDTPPNSNLTSLPLPPGAASALQGVGFQLPPPPSPGAVLQQPERKMEYIALSTETKKEKGKNADSYLPAGSFMTSILLSGVDAPTGGLAQSNPMPVTLRLMENAVLPNHFKSQVKDCFVIGAAAGEISSERAHIRIETLSCILKNGTVLETPAAGYVTGEDGKAGLRGRLVSKQGSMIAKAALAGTFSGIGQAVDSQYQQISTSALGSVQTYDPQKIGEAGLAKGSSKALEKIADFYLARANETYPVIEVDAKRIGEIILTKGLELGEKIAGMTRKGPEETPDDE